MPSAGSPSEFGRFDETHWSIVNQAAHGDPEARRDALGQLLEQYYPAMRAHLVRSRRLSLDQADDLLQSFIHEQILVRDLISTADPGRGRFRSLLLRSLNNFVTSHFRSQSANKRSPARAVSLNHDPPPDSGHDVAESDEFDVAWARQVLQEALERMRTQCLENQREQQWQLFRHRILGPALDGTRPTPYEELVEQLKFDNPQQACNALRTVRDRFRRVLESVVCDYSPTLEAASREIRELQAILGRAGTIGTRLPGDGLEHPPHPATAGDGEEQGTAAAEVAAAHSTDTDSPTEAEAAVLANRLESTAPELLAGMIDDGPGSGQWAETEMAALLQHQLASPLTGLLSDRLRRETVEQTGERLLNFPLRKLLQGEGPRGEATVAALDAVKRAARSQLNADQSEWPGPLARVVYFSAIAAAQVHYGTRISRSSDAVLQTGFAQTAIRDWVDPSLKQLLGKASTLLQDSAS